MYIDIKRHSHEVWNTGMPGAQTRRLRKTYDCLWLTGSSY